MTDIARYLPLLMKGAAVTAEVTLAAGVLGIAMSLVGGLARRSRLRGVRFVAGLYVEMFRGTSALIQLFWLFFVLPLFGVQWSPFTVAVIALGLNLGAYGSEVVRAGVQSIPQGQLDAAIALNMSNLQRLRIVILPQALVLMLPSFGNLMIELLKATALVSLITLRDLTFAADLLRVATGETILIFSMVLVIYFGMSLIITGGVRAAESRLGTKLALRKPAQRVSV